MMTMTLGAYILLCRDFAAAPQPPHSTANIIWSVLFALKSSIFRTRTSDHVPVDIRYAYPTFLFALVLVLSSFATGLPVLLQ
jgi:hypothetical protein